MKNKKIIMTSIFFLIIMISIIAFFQYKNKKESENNFKLLIEAIEIFKEDHSEDTITEIFGGAWVDDSNTPIISFTKPETVNSSLSKIDELIQIKKVNYAYHELEKIVEDYFDLDFQNTNQIITIKINVITNKIEIKVKEDNKSNLEAYLKENQLDTACIIIND